MFVLEESQLIEDTIVNNEVRDLYHILTQFEKTGQHQDLSRIISSEDGIGVKLSRLLLTRNLNKETKLSREEIDSICSSLSLEKDDVSALAMILSGTFLQLFVIENFIGQPTTNLNEELLPDIFRTMQRDTGFTALTVDSHDVHQTVVKPWLIRMSNLFWTFIEQGFHRKLLHLEFLVWKHRLLTTHLTLFVDPPESIMNDLRKVEEFIFDHHILNDKNNTQLCRFNVIGLCSEMIQSALMRGSLSFCRKFFQYASDESGIEIKHTGALGRRTKFQQTDISQLIIDTVTKEGQMPLTMPSDSAEIKLPLDVRLDDDTLLPEINFVEKASADDETRKMSIEAQLLMLNDLEIVNKGEAMEESLKDEYMEAYLRTIIRHASVYTLKYKALGLRSLVEKRYHRKMDRALRQLEALIQESIVENEKVSNVHSWFYSVMPPFKWQMQRHLGDVSYSLGLFKNALDVYRKIDHWEGIINCLCALQQTTKAEEIIRQELAKKESPYLYCLLGDVTDDVQYYEKSWAISREKFARAKKSIGTYYYVRKDYHEAIVHYEMAHKASPSNLGIISLLAYSCLTIENYERAAECYRNVTYLDDGSFLAWNNLSKAYIKLGQKERAWRTLREAVKCNYEEWKVWDNLLMVSIDIGELDDVIFAWHRLIDIKSSHKDDKTLNQLTFQIVSRPVDSNQKHEKLLSDALKLNARLISTSDCSPRVWICYFKLQLKEYELVMLKESKETKLQIDARISKIANALQRATPNLPASHPEFLQKPEEVERLLGCYEELIDCYGSALEVLGWNSQLETRWKSFKLSINNSLKTMEKKGYGKKAPT